MEGSSIISLSFSLCPRLYQHWGNRGIGCSQKELKRFLGNEGIIFVSRGRREAES